MTSVHAGESQQCRCLPRSALLTTKKGCQQGISKALGFQVGGNSLKSLKDVGSIHHMTVPIVRVGQGWTEGLTSRGWGVPVF